MRTSLVLLLLAALFTSGMSGCRGGAAKLWPDPKTDPGRDPKPSDLAD